jgi:hypothetical protein
MTDIDYLREGDAARLLAVSVSYLRHDRCSGRKPRVPYIKLGRQIRYRRDMLLKLAGAL